MPNKIISDINEGKEKIKISGNVKINYIDKIESMTDVIEFDNFNKSSFFINKKNSSALFYKYNKVKRKNGTIMAFDEWYVTNEFKTIFRRLYKINSQKFIIASYTLKSYDEDAHLYQIEGKNIMVFIDSNNFKIGKCHNIKISPLNNTICNFKNKYIILSYYDTLEDKNHIKRKNKGEQYTFENLDFMSEFYAISNYHFSDYWDNHWNDDNDNNNNEHYYNSVYKPKYFSYDITEHLIGIFSIKTEELVTIYEFDPIKILYNINDNILCLFEKSKDKRKKEQIANERMLHNYYNNYKLKKINNSNIYYRDSFVAFLQFDDGIKLCQDNFDYSNIISFVESSKGNLIIASKKKGIVLYNNI